MTLCSAVKVQGEKENRKTFRFMAFVLPNNCELTPCYLSPWLFLPFFCFLLISQERVLSGRLGGCLAVGQNQPTFHSRECSSNSCKDCFLLPLIKVTCQLPLFLCDCLLSLNILFWPTGLLYLFILKFVGEIFFIIIRSVDTVGKNQGQAS